VVGGESPNIRRRASVTCVVLQNAKFLSPPQTHDLVAERLPVGHPRARCSRRARTSCSTAAGLFSLKGKASLALDPRLAAPVRR